MHQLCIFDLDGTLADTLESLAYSVNATLREMGYPPLDKKLCQSFVGNGARNLMERSLKASGDTELLRIEEGVKTYGRIFDKYCSYHVVPYEGIPELIGELKARGVYLAVLSNKPHRQTVRIIEEIFGKQTFGQILGQQEGVPRKPDPFAALQIADFFKVKPEDSLYIGDSEVDIATGKAAGMKTLAVSWGFRSRQQLLDAGAEYMMDSPLQILDEI